MIVCFFWPLFKSLCPPHHTMQFSLHFWMLIAVLCMLLYIFIYIHLFKWKHVPSSVVMYNYRRGQKQGNKQGLLTSGTASSLRYTTSNPSIFSIRRMTAWGQAVSSSHLHCEVNTAPFHMPFSATLKGDLWTFHVIHTPYVTCCLWGYD